MQDFGSFAGCAGLGTGFAMSCGAAIKPQTLTIKTIMNIHLTLKSSNVKTGAIPVTTSSRETCPDACPLKAGGCYAKGGPMAIHWEAVSNGKRGDSLEILAKQIEAFPAGQLWRHNQAGDLPGIGNEIDSCDLEKLVNANRGKRGFTYTHKPVEGTGEIETKNRHAVKHANENGFTINLSANSLSHADRLTELNIAPVVAIVPHDAPETLETPMGRKAIVCPAQQRDDITCAKCQLCSRQRNVIIAFRAHGFSKKKAEMVANS